MNIQDQLLAAGSGLREQIEQMRGMFPDSDGAIGRALSDWEAAIKAAKQSANPPPEPMELLREGLQLMPLGTAKRLKWIERAAQVVAREDLVRKREAGRAFGKKIREEGKAQ